MHVAVIVLFALLQAEVSPAIRGTVVDPDDRPVANARVRLIGSQGLAALTTQTDAGGNFQFSGIADGSYDLSVQTPGFDVVHRAVRYARQTVDVSIELNVSALAENVSVTAEAGTVESVQSTPQQVSILDESLLAAQATRVLAQTAFESVGANLQRTSPTIGGIYVRGLTGKNVAVYVDGIRYTTSAQRGGINTFLNLNDPAELSRVEILRGPSSSQYGSDSLGGTLQLLQHTPTLSGQTPEWHGQFGAGFSSATLGGGANFRTSYSAQKFGLVSSFTGKRLNTLRPGRGIDTHAAVTRFLGLPSTVFGSRLTDTAFTQYGGNTRFNYLLGTSGQLAFSYSRNQQDGGKRYDQTLGGDGNLIADLRNLMGDFFYARFDTGDEAFLDSMSLSVSYNRQREERVNQGGNGNPLAGIVFQYERMNAFGMQWQANQSIGSRYNFHLGAEVYPERMAAPAFTFDPVTRTSAPTRPRVPDGARYTSGGAFTRHSVDAVPNRLRVSGALRWNAASYTVEPSVLWPSDSDRVSSYSGSAGAVATLTPALRVHFSYANGFRAPSMTDLGTLGLTGDGFEVASADTAELRGTIGSTADASAVSNGKPVEQLRAERTHSYETGIHVSGPGFQFSTTGFILSLRDSVVKQALILPPGAVGSVTLGGQPVVQQTAAGVVFVPLSTVPVLVRTNLDLTRHYGWEMEADYRISSSWILRSNATWVRAYDTATGKAPNIEGGNPAARGVVHVRYQPQRGRYSIQFSSIMVAPQTRFSTLDAADRRSLATRTRANIANFFNRGAVVHGLVRNNILLSTNETVGQVQDRVLGAGVNAAPMITRLPGFVLLNVRVNYRLGENQDLNFDIENLTDRNYRGVNWGVPGPGFDAGVRYSIRF